VSRFSHALLFALCVRGLAQESTAGGKADFPRLQGETDKVFAKWDSTLSPGCALSVVKDGRILYKRGYGMADLDHDIPITTETVFHVASISKQFTAASILLLAREHQLSLDDAVRKYIPELPDFGVTIRIHQLMHHTSGLRDQWALLGLAGWRYSLDLITDDDVLDVISRQKNLNFKPGDEYLYCNTGYTLLAQIVKRVSGQTLREFTTKRIFDPLGMKSTHFRDDHAEIVKHIAYGYEAGEGRNVFRLSVTNFDTVGATSLLTTVEDLALWVGNFDDPKVGGAAFVAQQLERGKLNSGKRIDYASGLEHGTYRGLATVGHSGADAGYRADLLRFPAERFAVACLCNQAETNPSALTRKVADIFLADRFKEPAPSQTATPTAAVSVSEDRLAQYAGLYWNESDQGTLPFQQGAGKLFLGNSEKNRVALVALAQNQFRFPDSMLTFTFEQAGGSAWRVVRTVQGQQKRDVYGRVEPLQLTADQLAGYAGAYVSAEIDPVYRITVDSGDLVLKRLKAKPAKLRPIVPDYFDGPNGNVHFLRDGSGKVTGFLLNMGRIRDFRFTKSPAM